MAWAQPASGRDNSVPSLVDVEQAAVIDDLARDESDDGD